MRSIRRKWETTSSGVAPGMPCMVVRDGEWSSRRFRPSKTRGAMRPKTDLLMCLSLAALVLCIYGRVGHYEFVGLDDPQYVSANATVQAGLTWAGAGWALRTLSEGNWHPLTWISHMSAWQLFGPWAGGHHMVNVFLHLVN